MGAGADGHFSMLAGSVPRSLPPGAVPPTFARVRPAYHTTRLRLQAWTPADAPARKAAVDAALGTLRPWFAWAADAPRPVEAHAALLAGHANDFAAGRWWGYGVWWHDRLIGALGVYRARALAARPSVRELSYWLVPDATGRGLATEAVGAVADAALAAPGVLALEIRVDPANEASARVPPRLGFFLRERVVGDRTDADGRPLDTLVWERPRTGLALRVGSAADLPGIAAVRASRAAGDGCASPTTPADDAAAVAAGRCWVWCEAAEVLGFAAIAGADGEAAWTVCVRPAAEGRGIGSALLAQATDALWALGHRRLALRAAVGSRGERVARAAGWVAGERTGMLLRVL